MDLFYAVGKYQARLTLLLVRIYLMKPSRTRQVTLLLLQFRPIECSINTQLCNQTCVIHTSDASLCTEYFIYQVYIYIYIYTNEAPQSGTSGYISPHSPAPHGDQVGSTCRHARGNSSSSSSVAVVGGSAVATGATG